MATKAKWVGQRMKRKEDPRLIQGLAHYVDDLALPGPPPPPPPPRPPPARGGAGGGGGEGTPGASPGPWRTRWTPGRCPASSPPPPCAAPTQEGGVELAG